MKTKLLLLVTLLISAISFSQTILLIEDFNTGDTPQYSTSMTEQIVNTSAYFTRTDGSNIGTPISFLDGEHYFAVQDIDTSPMTSPATMLFNDINIDTFTNLTFGVGLAEHDSGNGGDWGTDDFVHFEYLIDNTGSWKNLVWVENDGTANSAPQIDTDFDGVGDGVILINEFDEDVNFDIPETGTVIDIRVTFGGLTSADEDIAIDVIYLVSNFNLFPFVTITSPTNDKEFTKGTTSVNVEYTITNPDNASKIDIDVNGVLTSNYTGGSPITVPTEDGQSYFVDILVYYGSTIVSGEFVDFSVASTLGIDDNEILGLTVFPNPTALGYVNITSRTSETIKASVFDILGKQVINSTVLNNKLDISNLNTGIYILKLTQNDATSTKKLIIN